MDYYIDIDLAIELFLPLYDYSFNESYLLFILFTSIVMFYFSSLEIYNSFSKKLTFCFNSLISNYCLSSNLMRSVSPPLFTAYLVIFRAGTSLALSSLLTMKESILLRFDGGYGYKVDRTGIVLFEKLNT